MIDAVSCDYFHEQISAMLDGELSQDEQNTLNSHLEQCASCREHLEMMRFLIDSTKETMVDAPAELTASVMREIRAQGNVTPIRKKNNVLRFFTGHTFTVIAAAAAALVLFSPAVLDNLGAKNSSASANMAAPTASTTAAAAAQARILPATSNAATTAAAAVLGFDEAKPELYCTEVTSDSISAAAPAAGATQTKYASVSEIHNINTLDMMPDFSASLTSYHSVIILDRKHIADPEKLPTWLDEYVPELTEKGFFSFASLTDEQASTILEITVDGKTPRYIIPLYLLDDCNRYPILDPESKTTLFVVMALDEQ